MTVTRGHCEIRYSRAGGGYRIFDERSANGTRIVRNGEIIDVPANDPIGVAILDGDELQFGNAAVRVAIGPAARNTCYVQRATVQRAGRAQRATCRVLHVRRAAACTCDVRRAACARRTHGVPHVARAHVARGTCTQHVARSTSGTSHVARRTSHVTRYAVASFPAVRRADPVFRAGVGPEPGGRSGPVPVEAADHRRAARHRRHHCRPAS